MISVVFESCRMTGLTPSKVVSEVHKDASVTIKGDEPALCILEDVETLLGQSVHFTKG